MENLTLARPAGPCPQSYVHSERISVVQFLIFTSTRRYSKCCYPYGIPAKILCVCWDRNIVVGVATHCGLDGPGIECR
jgi:hypothetical protein